MRKLLLGAAASFCLLPAAANAAVLDLQTDAVTVALGETFDVRLVVDREMADLSGAAVTELDFTDDTLSFVSGMFMNLGDTTGTEFVGLFDSDTVEGFAETNDDAATLAGLQSNEFTLLSLTFEAIGLGRGEVELNAAFTELFGPDLFTALQTRIADGDVNVLIDVQPVPLPAGAVLLLTGLGGLAAARRRTA